MSNSERDLRRTNYLHFGGLGPMNLEDSTPGRIFPETISPDAWYFSEQNPTVRKSARQWVKAIKQICGVNHLGEITALTGHDARVKGITEIQELVTKQEIHRRFREAFAQRHRIVLTGIATTGIEFGITLSNTRKDEKNRDEVVYMSTNEVDDLINTSIHWAKQVRDYLDNPDTGQFRALSDVLPNRINEPRGINTLEDLLLLYFSPKWSNQARFEVRQILGLTDPVAEVLLYRRRFEGIKDELYSILNHHGVFDPSFHGPKESPYTFRTLHNATSKYVEGIEPILPDVKYESDPHIKPNLLKVREVEDPNGNYSVQINDDFKGIVQTVLKMIRKNTLDPAEIRDHYRVTTTFINREDIEKFITKVKVASVRARKPIIFKEEENTLYGGEYEAKTEGVPERHAGSSKKYQVQRLRFHFEDKPQAKCELSCYTLEAHVNYRNADVTGVGEYMLQRLIEHSPEKHDASVVDYILPPDIYGVDVKAYQEALVQGTRTSIRLKPFVPDSSLEKKPRLLTEGDIIDAVSRISEQINPRSPTTKPDYSKWPEIIIAVGPHTINAALALQRNFAARRVVIFDKNTDPIESFFQKVQRIISNRRILILDDVGIEAKTVSLLKDRYPRAEVAFLALQDRSDAQELNPYFGHIFYKEEYIFFPTQLHEFVQDTQSVFSMIYRRVNNQLEVLIQEEEKEESGQIITKFKLPGGTYSPHTRGDESTLETLREELEEELGEKMRIRIMKRLENIFPVDTKVLLDDDGPDAAANTLRIRGYYCDGTTINISDFIPPADSPVKALYWKPIDEAIDMMYRPGYKLLLRKAKERLQNPEMNL